MKGNVLFIITFFVATCACKKSSNNTHYIQFKIDNSTYTFDSVYAIVDTSVDHIAITSVYGLNTKTRSTIRFDLQSNSIMIAGSYSRTQNQSNPFILGFNFTIISGPNVYVYNLQLGSFSVTVNQSGNNNIHGSFSGIVSEQIPAQTVTIANGQFGALFKYY